MSSHSRFPAVSSEAEGDGKLLNGRRYEGGRGSWGPNPGWFLPVNAALDPMTRPQGTSRVSTLLTCPYHPFNICWARDEEQELRTSTSVGDPEEDVHAGVSAIMSVGCSSTAAQRGQTHPNVTLKLHYSSFQIPVLISKFSCNNRPGLETFVSAPASLPVPSNRNMLDSSIKHHLHGCFANHHGSFAHFW